MKKHYIVFSADILLKYISLIALCSFSTAHLHAQLRFSEVSGDSGNNDGTNDGIVELINTGNSTLDAGCYVISNSEWIVILPPGTFIPPGEVFLIACSEGQNFGANPNPIPGSGLTCSTCDFPSMPIHFDVCDPINAAYVDWAATGFTIDNQDENDGDQIVLFAPNGAIVQAVQWGGGSTFAGTDNTTISGAGYGSPAPYTLGSSTPLNGNGLTSAQLPAALQPGGSCFQNGLTYVMPAINSGMYEDLTYVVNPDGKAINNTVLQGCNSSFIYDPITDLWEKTDHPNPGLPNDAPAFTYSFSAPLTQCASATQPITVTLEVYNWQAVSPGVINARGGVGSFVSFDGGNTTIPWDTYTRDNNSGVTTLTYTFTPNMNASLNLIWDDDNSSAFASTPTGSSSATAVVNNTTPSDCYTRSQYNITVVPPMTTPKTDISCPADFSPGTINIGSLITGGFNPNFELFDNGILQATNQTGIFSISNNLAGPLSVVITDASGCSNPITINIDNSCRQAPACPDPNGEAINGAGDPLSICPEENFTLSVDGISSVNMPNGGEVDWFFSTNENFNPWNGEGNLLGKSDITVMTNGVNCPADGSNVFISELADPQSNASCDRFIEIFNAGPCPQDLIGWRVDVIGNFSVEFTFNLSGTINPGQALTLGTTAAQCGGILTYTPDFSGNWNTFSFNGQQRDGARLYDSNNTLIDDAAQANSATNSYADGALVRNTNISNGNTTFTISEWMLVSGSIGTANGPSPGLHNGAYSSSANLTNITDLSTSFGNDQCGQTLYIKGITQPLPDGCDQANATTMTFEVNVAPCPIATLSGDEYVCSPATGTATITVSDDGGAFYTGNLIRLSDNSLYPFSGVAPITIVGLPAGEFIIYDISAAGVCAPTLQGSATVNVSPAPDVSISGTFTACQGSVATIPLTIYSGDLPFIITYNLNGGAPRMLEVFNNQLNIPTTDLASGVVYSVNIMDVQDASGCTGNAEGVAMLRIQSSVIVEAGVSQRICKTKILDIQTLNPFILQNSQPFPEGNWYIVESDSNGYFLDEDGTNLGNKAEFTLAKFFSPGSADILRGYVTLSLDAEIGENACTAVGDTVKIYISSADCGIFPWNGGK